MNLDHLFNEMLIEKYNIAGPRYTSYPTAVQFNTDFSQQDYQDAVKRSEATQRALSLYFHLPFCDTVCFYCGCNKIITKNRKRAQPYLKRLVHEIELQSQLFSHHRTVNQLHWGGGTPTFLSHDEMAIIMEKTAQHFTLLPDDKGEYSIEVDPREAGRHTIQFLRSIGFNRLSMGVQDFDPRVQVAVNRIQPQEITFETLHAAREYGFKSISLDLIYGLPLQTVASFERTIDLVLTLSPDRLAVFNYAHMPHLFKTQKQMNEADLPSAAEKLAILKMTMTKLTEAGYVYIGMDHFAKPQDELALAQKAGQLYRNFQGYSTHADCDLVGIGITSISQINNIYAQNVKEMSAYESALDQHQLPIWRGVVLNRDDEIRRFVITELMCNLSLDLQQLNQQFQINADDYFHTEFARLSEMEADGLIQRHANTYVVKTAGRLLIRNIVMVFDHYLKAQHQQRFSKVI